MLVEVQSNMTTVKNLDDGMSDFIQDNNLSGNAERMHDSSSSAACEKWRKLRADLQLPFGPATTTNMAELERAQKSLREIPYAVTEKIMRSMDTDKGWEVLAGAAGCTMEEILLLKSEQYKGDGSPTRKLLWQLGCQSYKVHDLFEKLKEANRIYEMNILKEYVLKGGPEPKYTSFSSSSSQSGSHSLESLISQLDLSGPHSQPRMSSSSEYNSSPGSDINFNRHSNIGMSQLKMGGVKVYDDKVIPGAEQSFRSSSSASKFLHGGSALPDVLRRHAESTAVQPCRCQHQAVFGSVGTDFTLPSTPLSISSSGNSSTEAAQRLMNQLTGKTTPPKSSSSTPVESQSDDDVAIGMKASFTYQEIYQATQNFCDQNYVGHGAFGTVYYGCLRSQECAIKMLNEAPKHQSERWEQLKKELTPLLTYQHKNIVTLYGYALDGPKVCLVYEYLQNGSLDDRLRLKNNTPSLPWERRLNILVGACKGLNFLHTIGKKPLIHGDIKSANILLDRYLEAKICDLGQAAYATSGTQDKASPTHITIAESSSKLFGTKAYQAPEVLGKSSISIKSDIFSLGVVILEVCSGLPAYDQNRNENKFLGALYKNQIKERDESEWMEEFRDKTTSPPAPNIFIKLLKIADRCIRDAQTPRPKSDKLLEQIDQLYQQCQETLQEMDGTFNSVSTSVRVNSDISTHSNYPSLSDVVSSVGINSGVGISNVGHSMVSQGGALSPHISLQNIKMRKYGSPMKCCEQTLPAAEPTPMSQVPSSSSNSLENDLQSEPLRLQELYDKHPGKRIDNLSVSEKTNDINTVSQDESTLPSLSEQVTSEDYFPPTDPHKMEMLMGFDAQNFTPSSEDDISIVHECSEDKIRYLTDLTDEVLAKTPRPSSVPSSTPTAADVGQLTEAPNRVTSYHETHNSHSSAQNISSSNPWQKDENGSVVKRSSDIDNNAVALVAGDLEVAGNGEFIQSQNCDAGHHSNETQQVKKTDAEIQGRILKRQNLFSSYNEQVKHL